MNMQAGERYQCTDPECGCEIQVTSPGRAQSYGTMTESAGENSIGGSATGETGVGTLRNAESGGISTPGDFGSQGATGEGVFGTSGGGQRSTMSGRFGSSTASLGSGRTGSPATGAENTAGFSGSSNEASFGSSSQNESFSCCCGQPMRKSTSSGVASSRAARA
jgi:hypothetical protein